MKFFFPFLTLLTFSCSRQSQETHLFEDLTNTETATIYLSHYHLDSVPKEIGQLKKAKNLYIIRDSLAGWVIYPPLSALSQVEPKPPFKQLPDEITELTQLETLALVRLQLNTLPNDLAKLENLDKLSLQMNKLTISRELEKLKGLKKLKYLELSGNRVVPSDIEELKKANPNLTVEFDIGISSE